MPNRYNISEKLTKNIRKTYNGKFYVQIMHRRKLFTRTFDRMIDAYQFIDKIKQQGTAPQKMSFNDAANEWLNLHAAIKKTRASKKCDEDMLRLHIMPLFAKKELGKVQPRDIEELIKAVRLKGLSDSTVNRNLEVLSAIFNYHIKRQNIQFNPVQVVGKLKVPEQSYDFWTTEEAERFLAHTEQKYKGTPQWKYHLFYLTAINTGLRRGELLAIRWEDINFSNEVLTVRRSYSNSTREIVESTKNKRIRHVPLPSWLCKELIAVKGNSPYSELVFTVSGVVMEPNNFYSRNFVPDMKAANVRRIRMHDLRHTFASHYMMNGGNIFHLQHILGHCSIKMTMRYAHFSNDYLDKTRNIVHFGDNGKVINVDFQRSVMNA